MNLELWDLMQHRMDHVLPDQLVIVRRSGYLPVQTGQDQEAFNTQVPIGIISIRKKAGLKKR
jgi:hypothetical protein